LILASATMAGVALAWSTWPDLASNPRQPWPGRLRASIGAYEIAVITPILSAWSMAVVSIRARAPRPRPWALAREPGVAACLGATLAVSASVLWAIAVEVGMSDPVAVGWRSRSVFRPIRDGAIYGVAGAWLAIAMAGRWAPSPGWIDRIGRVVAVLWIVAALARVIGFVVLDLWPTPPPDRPPLLDILGPEPPR
jgi:hypothetical protein